jgi:ATP-binding cassette, subfamily B, multidrug efflux pump
MSLTLDQLKVQLEADVANAPQTLMINALILIIVFAALRGLFAFLQAFWAEKNSQAVAYDCAMSCMPRSRRCPFRITIKTRRAVDDPRHRRCGEGAPVHRAGTLQLSGAVILLTGTVIILFTSNATLAWTAMPILPVALVTVHDLWRASQPLFAKVQQKLSALEYGAAGKPGGHQGDQGIHA